jgi:large repetitive protein
MSRRRVPFLSGTVLVVALVVGLPTAALAAYIASGASSGNATAATFPAPGKPAATDSPTTVSVSWAGTSLSTGRAVDSYQLKRTVGATTTTVCTTTNTTCTDSRQSSSATYVVVAKVGGWSSASATSAAFISDFVAPTSSISISPAVSANGWVKSSNPTVSLSATDALSGVSSVAYTVNGGSTVTTNGSSVSFALGQGTFTIQYWATDTVGNTESKKSVTYKVKGSTVAPSNFAISSDSGSSSSDLITNVASQTFSGSAEAGASVQVVYNGTTKTATANASGNWSVSLTLAEGAKAATVTATDAAGNTNSASQSLRLDTVDPTVIADTPVAGTLYTDNSWDNTCANRGGPGICGTASDTNGSGVDDVTYELRKSGLLGGNYQCWNGNAWAPGQCGKQQVPDSGPSPWWASVPTNSMPNGFILSIQMRLVLTVTDIAGNSATSTISFTKY